MGISTQLVTRTRVISVRDAERALRTALSRGGDFAELFWERHETLQLVLDDGRIDLAVLRVDRARQRIAQEKGASRYPVQGITIAGNLTQLLSAITGVGTDLVFGPSGIGSPTLVISELSIGGT